MERLLSERFLGDGPVNESIELSHLKLQRSTYNFVFTVSFRNKGEKIHQKSGVQNMTEESITEAIHTLLLLKDFF